MNYEFSAKINADGQLQLSQKQAKQLPRNVHAQVTIVVEDKDARGFSAEGCTTSWKQVVSGEPIQVEQLCDGLMGAD